VLVGVDFYDWGVAGWIEAFLAPALSALLRQQRELEASPSGELGVLPWSGHPWWPQASEVQGLQESPVYGERKEDMGEAGRDLLSSWREEVDDLL
jgi:hypothetical protein